MRSLLFVVALTFVIATGLYLTRLPADPAVPEPVAERPAAPEPITAGAPLRAAENSVGEVARAPALDPMLAAGGLLRSDSAFQGLYFAAERGLVDLDARLREALQAIESGAALGHFDLARVISNCTLAEDAAELVEAEPDASPPDDEWAQEMQRVVTECAPVLRAVPAGMTASEWQLDNLRRAAELGDPLAALELAVDYDAGSAPYDDVLALTRAAVQTGDYRSYFLAADFLTELHDPAGADINEPRAMQWYLLGCRRSPLCEPDILEAQLALDYTPAQLDEFRAFARNSEAAIERGEPLDFEAGWLGLNEGE